VGVGVVSFLRNYVQNGITQRKVQNLRIEDQLK